MLNSPSSPSSNPWLSLNATRRYGTPRGLATSVPGLPPKQARCKANRPTPLPHSSQVNLYKDGFHTRSEGQVREPTARRGRWDTHLRLAALSSLSDSLLQHPHDRGGGGVGIVVALEIRQCPNSLYLCKDVASCEWVCFAWDSTLPVKPCPSARKGSNDGVCVCACGRLSFPFVRNAPFPSSGRGQQWVVPSVYLRTISTADVHIASRSCHGY